MITFLTFFILTYKVIINSTNINEVLTNSSHIPAFILIYSPYCPHCTKVHPDWIKLMDQYENDTKIIAAECNAISDGESCRKIYDYKGFPSFISFTRRRGVWLRNLNRTLPSFINESERLKAIDLSFPCPLFKTDFTNEYPAITINMGGSKNESCSNLQRIEKIVSDASSFLYVGEENESQLIAKLSESYNVTYNGDNNDQSYADFIKEYAIKQFEAHSTLIKYTSYNRKIVLIIYSLPGQIKKLQTLGEAYYKDIIFATSYYRNFNKTYSRIQVTPPAAIVSNKDKTKFAIFNNLSIDTNSSKQFLEKVKNDDYVADTQLPMLFPPHQNQKRINIVNPLKQIKKMAAPTNRKEESSTQNQPERKQTENKQIKANNNENNNQAPAQGEAELRNVDTEDVKRKDNSKFVPIFLFAVGLVVMIAIGIFAYLKIRGKNGAKIE